MYKVTKRDCPMFGIGPYVCEFICDTASDISTLPTSISEGTGGKSAYDNQKCASGSIAIVVDNGAESKQYMLNNQDIWCPYSVAAGSSGGSSESSITVDFALSETSENPVANKTITAALNNKADADDIPDLTPYAKKTDVPGIKVNEAVNADTVGGYSVGCDVPADAKFTDTVPDLSLYALKTLYGDTTINVGRAIGSKVGDYSTAEGSTNESSDFCSHAEGNGTTASGFCSHTEGNGTTASGAYSHAGGYNSTAQKQGSFAHGGYVNSTKMDEVAFGKYNKSSSDTLFSVGDGTDDSARHNAFEITTTGGKLHDKDIATIQRYAPIYTGDLLDMTEMGTYSCSKPEVTNLPSGIAQWCYVTMIQFRDTGYRRYICIPLNNAVTDANELYLATECVRDSEGKLIWRNISDGGTAYTISEWGIGRICSDVNNAELGFSVASNESINAPNTFWSTILTTGQTELYQTQIAFPWACDRNSQKIKYRSKDNGTWNEWAEIYTSGNKPYITGSATVAAGDNTCITNHGFTPSAVLWWGNSGGREIRSASSFNTTSFNPSMIDTSERVLNYIIFK